MMRKEHSTERLPDPYARVWDTETEERGILDAGADCAQGSIWNDPDPKAILDCMPQTENLRSRKDA